MERFPGWPQMYEVAGICRPGWNATARLAAQDRTRHRLGLQACPDATRISRIALEASLRYAGQPSRTARMSTYSPARPETSWLLGSDPNLKHMLDLQHNDSASSLTPSEGPGGSPGPLIEHYETAMQSATPHRSCARGDRRGSTPGSGTGHPAWRTVSPLPYLS